MDVTSLLEVKPAPRAVFDRLATHRDRARFQVRKGAGWEPVTWGQFASQIRGVAKWLIESGIEAGDRVAIFGDSSVAWASAALGAQTAAAVFVPIYPASTPAQVAYILDHAEAKVVFVGGGKCAATMEKARCRSDTAVIAGRASRLGSRRSPARALAAPGWRRREKALAALSRRQRPHRRATNIAR